MRSKPAGRSQSVPTPGDSEGTETTAALSKDDIFSILQNSRRRSAVRWLAEWDGKGTTGKLAVHIAAEENDIAVLELTSNQWKRVYIALYQGHLPKLADYGVVAFDQSRETVGLTEAADDISVSRTRTGMVRREHG